MDNSIARSAASYYKSQRFSLILNDRFNFLFFFVLCWPGFLFKVWNTWLNLTYSRPWTVWAVLRTRINSNKICSKLNIILVKITQFSVISMTCLCSEKVIYFLLLDRKKRKPSYEDDTEVMVRARCGSSDPPRKRIDHCKMNGVCYSQLSEGSPITPRRNLYRLVIEIISIHAVCNQNSVWKSTIL